MSSSELGVGWKVDASEVLTYLSARDVGRVLSRVDPISVVREVIKRHARGLHELPDEATHYWTDTAGSVARSLVMPGGVAIDDSAERVVRGTKIINANLGNPGRGLPRAQGLLLLHDPITAWPCAVLEGGQISAVRTAAVAAISVELLAASRARVLGLVGLGTINGAVLQLLAAGPRQFERVLVFDVLPEAIDRFIEAHPGINVERAPDVRSVVTAAEVVVFATTTTEPHVEAPWLVPGDLLVNLSLDDLDADCYARANLVVVDDWRLTLADQRRLLGRLVRRGDFAAPGAATPGHLRSSTRTAELGELVDRTSRGRVAEDDIVIVNPFGMALLDVALGSLVLSKALEWGIGQRLQR